MKYFHFPSVFVGTAIALFLFVGVAPADAFPMWTQQTSGTLQVLRAIDFVPTNHAIAWAVGDRGTILKTTNGGATWTPQTSGTSNDLYGLDVIDANTAWTVGGNGTILKTTNGGAMWQAMERAEDYMTMDIDVVDANTAWIVGRNGLIQKTTNGGTTWTRQTSGTTYWLNKIYAIDTNTAWAVGAPIMLRTIDGGNTWVKSTLVEGLFPFPSLSGVVAFSSDTAWSVGSSEISAGIIIRRVSDATPAFIGTPTVTTAIEDGYYLVDISSNIESYADTPTKVHTYRLVASPTSMTIGNISGGITWNPNNKDIGNHTVTVEVKDTTTSITAQQTFVVTVANTPPTFLVLDPLTSATVGIEYTYDFDADDEADGFTKYRFTTAPTGMVIDEDFGTISWTPTAAQAGDQTATVVVDDGHGGTAEKTWAIAVTGTTSPPPEVTVPSAFNVFGWAWADNIGWISFNGGNDHNPAVAGVQTSSISYGVNIDPATLKFSGYAWSDNVGWISFNKSDAGEPPKQPFNNGDQNYIAKRDGALILGWGKILPMGERGWLRFVGTATSSSAGIDIATGKFTGWMWNGNTDGTGIGWVSLNCANTAGECARSDYAVTLGSAVNVKPDAPVRLSPKSTDDQVAIQSMQGQYLYFKWSAFEDDNQPNDCERQFTIEIFRGATITTEATPIEKYLSPDRPNCQNGPYVDVVNQKPFRVWGGLTLEYNTIYTWRAQTWDKAGEPSGWSASASFTTPKHALPEPKITPPVDPKVGVGAGFTDVSRVYDQSGRDQTTDTTTGGGTNSIKFWKWNFGDGVQSVIQNPTPGVSQTTLPDGTPVDLKNPEYTYTTPGRYSVCLTITDEEDYSSTECKDVTVSVQRSLPIWRRIIPF